VKFGNAVRYPVDGLEDYIARSFCDFTGQKQDDEGP
jgi:hypothetical protein